jgi:branched-chain amino acid transport system substrate-binding protein
MSYNKDTDFYSGVSRVLASNPDVLFVGGASEPTGLVIKQARELGFQGGFIVMDQAKLDEISKTLGGMTMAEGAIGTLPLIYDKRPGPVEFTARFQKQYSRDPGSEVSLNYSAMNAFAEAMKLAGSVSDGPAIFAKLNQAFAGLPPGRNPSVINGVDAKGGSNAAIVMGFVKGGQVVAVDGTGALQN